MRATIQNYVQAERERREENDEKGFSLIELIIVVVILGILAAIAIPVFMGLQGQAEQSALESTVANGASQVAADVAQGEDRAAVAAALTSLGTRSDVTLTLTKPDSPADPQIDDYCVSGKTDTITTPVTSGPGC